MRHIIRKNFYAIVKQQDADQPAHQCSLISVFVVHRLDSSITIVAISEIPRHLPASVAEQVGLTLAVLHDSESSFSHDMLHL